MMHAIDAVNWHCVTKNYCDNKLLLVSSCCEEKQNEQQV